jgi:hypothetical protein
MQLTNLQVLNVAQGLNSIGNEKLPIRLSWKISTAVQSLQPFQKLAEASATEIKSKYSVRDEMGNIIEALDEKGENIPGTIQIAKENIDLLNKELEELFSQTVEVHNVEFSLTDFPADFKLTPAALSLLLPIIKDESTQELKLV